MLPGRSSLSRAAASAAVWAVEGAGAPVAMLGWCSYATAGRGYGPPPLGDGAGGLTMGRISGSGWRAYGGSGVWLADVGKLFGWAGPLDDVGGRP